MVAAAILGALQPSASDINHHEGATMAKDKTKAGKAAELDAAEPPERAAKIKSKTYLEELSKLQVELVEAAGVGQGTRA